MTTKRRTCLLALAVAATLTGMPRAQEGSSTMGHARARRAAALGRLPDPGEIVVDHLINYHRHAIRLPAAGEAVAVEMRWDVPLATADESVLQIGLATSRLHDLQHVPPLNLALVIDVSGSMADRDKMSRVKRALRRFTDKLRPTDCLAIVAYCSVAKVLLPSARVGNGARILQIVDCLEPSGATNLHAGLMCGYQEVARHYDAGATNRVILLTDGISNHGVVEPKEIAHDSLRYNREGIDLSTIGVGQDFNRELLAELAEAGRGLFHFVADEVDIEKVFDTEVQSLMGAVARDVELHVTHDPGIEVVRVYGYAPRTERHGFSIRLEDFNLGLTNVVLAKFRRVAGHGDDGEVRDPGVRVELCYRDAQSREPRSVVARSRFLDPRRAVAGTDHEVRKNHTIAVMARALRRLAEAAKAKRFGDAERHAATALDYATLQYPSTSDEDLLVVRRMLETNRKLLAARIERFRDL